jgi:hypothetical protein
MVCENPIAIDVHASEFIEHKGGAALADAALDENDRPPALETYGDGDYNERGQQHDNGRQGDGEIQRSPKPSLSLTWDRRA